MLGPTPAEGQSEERRLPRSGRRLAIGGIAALAVLALIAGIAAYAATEDRAEDDPGGSTEEPIQENEDLAGLPADFDAVRLPVEPTESALSPDGSMIALAGTPPGGDLLTEGRVVVGDLEGQDHDIVDADENVTYPDLAWLDDERVLLLEEGTDGSPQQGHAALVLVSVANGAEVIGRTEFEADVAWALEAFDPQQVLLAADHELMIVDVSEDGEIRLGEPRPMPETLDTSFGVDLHVDPATAAFWLSGGTVEQVWAYDPQGDTTALLPWVGERDPQALPLTRVAGPWGLGRDELLLNRVGNDEASPGGGTVYLLDRTRDEVLVRDALAVGDQIADTCVTTDAVAGRLLATAAPGERLLQAEIGDDGFVTRRSYGIDSVVDVACSEVGRTAWLTQDGVVLATEGALSDPAADG